MAVPATSIETERLRYVTENFQRLQGLERVALGVIFLVPPMGGVDWLPAPGWAQQLLTVALMLAWLRYTLKYQDYIPEYYRTRFGWVRPRVSGRITRRQIIACLLFFAALLFFGRSIGRFADSIIADIHLDLSDPGREIRLYPVVLWLLTLYGSLRWPLQREDSYRLSFMFLGLSIFVAVALSPAWHPGVRQFVLWKALNAESWGLSFIAIGLYDHMTLVRLMPRRIVEDADGEDDYGR
jgi:hypothetical protein